MSKVKIAINGFGRIGRLALKALLGKVDVPVQVVAINDLTDPAMLAHLFKYDTAHGKYAGTVAVEEGKMVIDGQSIHISAERDPAQLPWAELGIDLVLECTGFFRSKEDAAKHITAGAKKVAISAPAKGTDVKTIVLGINNEELTAEETIVSNASCTTNCLSQLVKVLHESFGVKEGVFTTVHAYTSDQRIQDAPHKDWRRSRAAAQNIIPTSTGAAKALALVMPSMEGKLTGIAARVPVITGSLTDLNCVLEKPATVAEINAAFQKAAEGELKGILEYTEVPLVSGDIISNPHSCIFDSGMTIKIGNTVKVIGWYDNEAGYANRLADLAVKMAALI